MRRLWINLLALMICSLLLAACGTEHGNDTTGGEMNDDSSEEEDQAEDETPVPNEDSDPSKDNDEVDFEPEEPEVQNLEQLSDELIEALLREDMETVAHYVHPEKGLLFSPYGYVEDEAVVMSKDDVPTMLESDEIFTWGIYDGVGTPIELTAADYFEEFLDMSPYEQPDEILVNEPKDRGNTINNVEEKFPNAQIIEYYNEGKEEYAGMDWSSVLFVYEENENGELQLVAIVRDMWTI